MGNTTGGSKYSKKAQEFIGRRMKDFAGGDMYGGKGRAYQVTTPAQAKAISLSEARSKGMKVPSGKK